jgi:hypothetical protein
MVREGVILLPTGLSAFPRLSNLGAAGLTY